MVEIKLDITPQEFNHTDIGEVEVSFGAINKSARKQETHLNECTLYINGEYSFAWSMTLGNGHRSDSWYHLSGKDSVKMTWKHLAKSLFSEPGTYDLRLELGEKVIQEMVVVSR